MGAGGGTVLRGAGGAARGTLSKRRRGTDAPAIPAADVPAETSSMAQQQADALALLAEPALHHGLDPGASGERYQAVVHADAPGRANPDAPGPSGRAAGPPRSAETPARLA